MKKTLSIGLLLLSSLLAAQVSSAQVGSDVGSVVIGSTGGSSGGGAPVSATYLLQVSSASLPSAQAMGALGTGIVISTTTTGVQSIYAGTSCTNQVVTALSASGVATCASVNLGTMALKGTNQNSGARAATTYIANGATAQEVDIYGTDGGSTSTSFLAFIIPSTGEDNATAFGARRGDGLGINIPVLIRSNGDGAISLANNTAEIFALAPTTTRIGSKGTNIRSDACYGFANTVSGPSIDTITSCLMYEASGRIKVTTNSGGSTYADIDPKQVYLAGALAFSGTAPTVSAGFGTSPTVATGSRGAAFKITVGSGGSDSTGTVTLPTATTGWVCRIQDITTPSTVTNQTGTTTTTAAFTSSVAWTASDTLLGNCVAF